MGPSKAAQAALLTDLRLQLEPILIREGLPLGFYLVPGLRLRRAYGRCVWRAGSEVPTISVRCTADGNRLVWRRRGAIVGTLLHELAHLRYRSHGPRFWALHRRLVDRAAKLGVYDPLDRDPAERARGDEKLAASAAWPIAMAARQRRLERSRLRRAPSWP
ncbi:MAG: M48 family metallopeptidase [Chloroflexi bacterium]|nr:M48 family metallopeptidase [Chloroflexota bacterium]MBV9895993.1 M48 family metallopeptidase [Chloroflexota bacterium]